MPVPRRERQLIENDLHLGHSYPVPGPLLSLTQLARRFLQRIRLSTDYTTTVPGQTNNRLLCEDFLDDMRFSRPSQTLVQALIKIAELLVIEAHQMEDCGM